MKQHLHKIVLFALAAVLVSIAVGCKSKGLNVEVPVTIQDEKPAD